MAWAPALARGRSAALRVAGCDPAWFCVARCDYIFTVNRAWPCGNEVQRTNSNSIGKYT